MRDVGVCVWDELSVQALEFPVLVFQATRRRMITASHSRICSPCCEVSDRRPDYKSQKDLGAVSQINKQL